MVRGREIGGDICFTVCQRIWGFTTPMNNHFCKVWIQKQVLGLGENLELIAPFWGGGGVAQNHWAPLPIKLSNDNDNDNILFDHNIQIEIMMFNSLENQLIN